MRAVITWVDKVHDRDRNEQCIYDLCFRYYFRDFGLTKFSIVTSDLTVVNDQY